MKQVNMHEAKSQLSKLGEMAWKGEKIVIAKAGKPYLDLVPHKSAEQDKVSLGDGCELCGGMGGCPVCSTRAAPAGRRIFDLGS